MKLASDLTVPDFQSWFDYKDWSESLSNVEQEKILAKCADDPIYFIDNWVWLLSMPEGWTEAGEVKGEGRPGWAQFRLWECQKRIIRESQGHLRQLIIKVRQIGLTWLKLAQALWQCIFRPNSRGVVISLEKTRAEDMSSRYEGMWQRLPAWMRKRMRAEKGDIWSRDEKQFTNGSALMSMPTTNYSGVSYTLAFAIVDEAALIEQEQKIDLTDIIDVSLDPACESMGAWISVITTGRLRSGWVWRTVSRIRSREECGAFDRPPEKFQWMLQFIPVTEHPLWPVDKYEAKLKEADDVERFRRERPREIDEAFSASGYCVFDVVSLRQRRRDIITKEYPKPQRVEFEGNIIPKGNPQGRAWIYWEPEVDERYCAFIDPSEGKSTGDNCAMVVLSVDSGRVACVLHGKYRDAYELADDCAAIGRYYNVCMLIPEVNNDRGLMRRLIELQYPNLYKTTKQDGWVERPTIDKYGWRTTGVKGGGTGGTRNKMIASLQHEIRRSWLAIPHEGILQECETFISTEKKPMGEAGPGAHDDLVIAMAGACYVARMEPDRIPSPDHFAGWEYGGSLANFDDVVNQSRRRFAEANGLVEEDEWDPSNIIPWRKPVAAEADVNEFEVIDTFLDGGLN